MSLVQAAASATRSFLTGGLAASAARVRLRGARRIHRHALHAAGDARPRAGRLRRRVARGAARRQVARRAARRAASRAAFAGAVAAAARARLRPDLAGAATELHAGVVFTAARTLSLPRRADAADGGVRRARAGEALARARVRRPRVRVDVAAAARPRHRARCGPHVAEPPRAGGRLRRWRRHARRRRARRRHRRRARGAARLATVHAAFNARTLARGTPGAARRVAAHLRARALGGGARLGGERRAAPRGRRRVRARRLARWPRRARAPAPRVVRPPPRLPGGALRRRRTAARGARRSSRRGRSSAAPPRASSTTARDACAASRRRSTPTPRARSTSCWVDAEDGGDSELGGARSTGDDGVVRPLKPEADHAENFAF